MLSTPALQCGRVASQVQAALDRLEAKRIVHRLWSCDPSLWSADAEAQAAIRRRLGWLTIAEVMAQQVESLRVFAQEIRQAGWTHVLLLGMGGSGLFSEVCRHLFGVAAGYPDLTVLDTTDPTAIRQAQRRCPLGTLGIIVSSKSGSTSEVTALSKYFYEAFKALDAHPGAHAIAITDAGTPLETQARAWKLRRVFVHGAGTGAEVGGRFSALTYFGLVPASLIGVDIATLLKRAREMANRCSPDQSVQENPAAQLGAVLGGSAQAGADKLTLLCAPALASFGTWVEQLIAESLGKQGRGIVPIHGESLREPQSYDSDRVFVELQLATRLDARLDAHVQALLAAGHPVIRIHWQDAYDLGGEVMKWSLATATAGALLGVNPFDEPNVKESKDQTSALLQQYARQGRWPQEGAAACSDADVDIYGAPPAECSQSLAQCLSVFVRRQRPREYLAVLSFLPRTSALDQATQGLRARLAGRSAKAVMLQYGPRYLHSTGQLFKGGPDAGLFLLLTADETQDLPIPGEPYTFGVLKQAQALGDFQAMQQRARRVLRLHLRGNIEQALMRVAGALEEAMR